MAQDVQAGLFFVQVGGAHIIFVVLGGKAQLPAECERFRQRGGGAGAEGHARLCVLPYAADAHQAGDGLNQLLLTLGVVKIGFDLRAVHQGSSFFDSFRPPALPESSPRYLYTVYRDTWSRLATKGTDLRKEKAFF